MLLSRPGAMAMLGFQIFEDIFSAGVRSRHGEAKDVGEPLTDVGKKTSTTGGAESFAGSSSEARRPAKGKRIENAIGYADDVPTP